VEEGFKQALAAGYEDAVDGLSAFYTALNRFSDAGKVYEEAALQEGEADLQLGYLLNAGLAYARAGDGEKAEAPLRQATALAPQNPRAYQHLAIRVFAPKGDLSAAKAVVAAGIEQGADPVALYLALGDAALVAKDGKEAKAALHQALVLQPSSFEAHFRLGLVYLQERNLDRATLALRKAANVDPSSASVFYYLGLAEEKRYQFFAAEKAYARAVTLAPDDAGLRRHYEDFLRKVAVERARGKGL
jgi:Tfp pilus assembly protein PilF